MSMTNQQKLQVLYDLTGPTLFQIIIEQLGPGTICIPKRIDRARRNKRNTAIRADFRSPEFSGMKYQEIYKALGERYELSPDHIRKIIQATSGSR